MEQTRIQSYSTFSPALLQLPTQLCNSMLKMADIVNAADTGDLKAHPYAAGLEAVARGFSLMFPNDDENLEHQFFVYDALYAALKCEEKGR